MILIADNWGHKILGDREERARIAAELRDEARTLLIETGILDLLTARFGEATVTGSAGYDLMVARDLDIHLPCDPERTLEWASLAGELAAQLDQVGLSLHRASFLNDYVDPHPLGAGLCWAIEFIDFAGNGWKWEIWGWDPFDFAVRQARDANFRADLSNCDRDLILALKHEVRASDYAGQITSFDIYNFVIEGAGASVAELQAWKGLA